MFTVNISIEDEKDREILVRALTNQGIKAWITKIRVEHELEEIYQVNFEIPECIVLKNIKFLKTNDESANVHLEIVI